MPVPVFSVNEVLTSSAMNQVGLWRVTTCTVTSTGGTAATASNGVITVGSGNTSVTVSNAFSSNFDNYRIVYSGGTASAVQAITMQMEGSTAGYYGNLFGASFQNTTTSANPIDNQSSWLYAGISSTINNHVCIDIFNPFLTKVTTINGTYIPTATNGFCGSIMGFHNSAASYTGFKLAVPGTISGGTIRVYGFRN